MDGHFYQIRLNAEPWAIGPLGMGRKGKGAYPFIGPNQKLQAYQEAIKESLSGAEIIEGEVEVRLYIWRQIETLKVYGGRDRKGKTSDATNIQKATEDAIQNLLIQNDRLVRRISTEIVSQDEGTEGKIVIHILPYVSRELEIPESIQDYDAPWGEPTANPFQEVKDFYDEQARLMRDIF